MKTVHEHRQRRHARVRRKVAGSEARPRLAVFRSNKHLYVQVIDDRGARTLVAASSLDPALRDQGPNSKEKAAKLGHLIAERAMEKGIKTVVFDRAGYRFHGKVKALADGAREKGLEF